MTILKLIPQTLHPSFQKLQCHNTPFPFNLSFCTTTDMPVFFGLYKKTTLFMLLLIPNLQSFLLYGTLLCLQYHRPVFKVRKPGRHRKIQRANGGRQAAKKSVFSISQDTLYTSPLTFGVKKAVIIISRYTFQVHFQKMHVMGQKV